MSQADHSRNILPSNIPRSIGALLAGFVFVFVLSIGTDVALHASGVYPPWFHAMSTSLWLLATAYRTVYCIAGCYIAARLASARPMMHAMVLGILGLAVSTVGVVSTWNRGPDFGPHWYPLALVATALPCAWIGGWLRVRQMSVQPAA
jgi:hypothetical protein